MHPQMCAVRLVEQYIGMIESRDEIVGMVGMVGKVDMVGRMGGVVGMVGTVGMGRSGLCGVAQSMTPIRPI